MSHNLLLKNYIRSLLVVYFGASMLSVYAGCGCPDDGIGYPVKSHGLGESYPDALNISADLEWKIYEFERDGIKYFQINDRGGNIYAALGVVDELFFVMPIGVDASNVILEGVELAGNYKIVHKSENIEILLYKKGFHRYWKFSRP